MGKNNIDSENWEKKYFAPNISKLIENSGMKQSEFAKQMNISASTLSLYITGKRKPTIDFIIDIKKQYPQLSIDSLLFDIIVEKEDEEVSKKIINLNVEIQKFVGLYYLYYLDNSIMNVESKGGTGLEKSSGLKTGLLYISDTTTSYASTSFKSLLLINVASLEDVTTIKKMLSSSSSFDHFYENVNKLYPHKIYVGEFDIRRTHESILVRKTNDDMDSVLILLRRLSNTKERYTGGIGTINSMSSGKDTDPVIQKIAITRDTAYVSEEEIKNVLLFAKPKLNIRDLPETKSLVNYVKSIYSQEKTAYSELSDKEKEILLVSYLEYCLKVNIEKNQLCFSRVSSDEDESWNHSLLDASKEYVKRDTIEVNDEKETGNTV